MDTAYNFKTPPSCKQSLRFRANLSLLNATVTSQSKGTSLKGTSSIRWLSSFRHFINLSIHKNWEASIYPQIHAPPHSYRHAEKPSASKRKGSRKHILLNIMKNWTFTLSRGQNINRNIGAVGQFSVILISSSGIA